MPLTAAPHVLLAASSSSTKSPDRLLLPLLRNASPYKDSARSLSMGAISTAYYRSDVSR
jgi:hypothetical protein